MIGYAQQWRMQATFGSAPDLQRYILSNLNLQPNAIAYAEYK
jgi:hypothetical protein